MNKEKIDIAKKQAIQKARELLENNAIIIDTETTGLDETAEIVEISAIDCTGKVLMDSFVKPRGEIPVEASNVHGITADMLVRSPSWSELHGSFFEMIEGRHVAIYNSQYDTRIIKQTAGLFGLQCPQEKPKFPFTCAMLVYSAYRGQWNYRKNGFRWYKLTDAVNHEGIDVSGITAHRALGDVQMTLELLKVVANKSCGDTAAPVGSRTPLPGLDR